MFTYYSRSTCRSTVGGNVQLDACASQYMIASYSRPSDGSRNSVEHCTLSVNSDLRAVAEAKRPVKTYSVTSYGPDCTVQPSYKTSLYLSDVGRAIVHRPLHSLVEAEVVVQHGA